MFDKMFDQQALVMVTLVRPGKRNGPDGILRSF